MSNFKVGDWVVITKSIENWAPGMDSFDGKCVQIIYISPTENILFDGSRNYTWRYSYSHFRKATSKEIVTAKEENVNEIIMGNFKKYKVGEIKNILEKIYNDSEVRRHTVPLFMSNSGLGKTFIIEEFMREKGVYKPPLVLSQRMPFEVSGMALVDKERDVMRYYNFDFILELKDGDILFIDETYNANPLTLSAFLTFLESRIMISGKALPDIMIVAAANPQGMPVLTPQTRRRFLQYDIVFDPESWRNFLFKKYTIPVEISSKLCKLVKNEDFSAYNYDTPADLDDAIDMVIKDIPTPYSDSLSGILSTLIDNKLKQRVKLAENVYLEPDEKISWLRLKRFKDGIITE